MSDEQLKPSPVRKSPDLPQTPAAQERVNNLFNGYIPGADGHVADKILDALFEPIGRKRPTNWTNLRPLPSDCNFGVIQEPKFRKPDEKVTKIIIEMPNPDPQWATHEPRIQEVVTFGLRRDRYTSQTVDDPTVLLTEGEIEVVNEALRAQQAEVLG